MRRRMRLVSLAVGCMNAFVQLASADPDPAVKGFDFIGFAGPNGRGYFPGCNPPIEWAEYEIVQTGKVFKPNFEKVLNRNILWKASMPNWGYGCPIIIQDRVFVISEPGWKTDFPVLSCYHISDGRELWRREINHLNLVTADEEMRKALGLAWHEHLKAFRLAHRLTHEYKLARDDAAREAISKRARAAGLKERESEKKAGSWWYPGNSPIFWTFKRAGLFLDCWQHWGYTEMNFYGSTWPTPCTDGEHLYVALPSNIYACYSIDGKVKWMKWYPALGANVMSYGDIDHCKFGRSPILWRDLFIADLGYSVRAFDRETGALKWEHLWQDGKFNPSGTKKVRGFEPHSPASPVVIDLKGTSVLWCVGRGLDRGKRWQGAFRLPDGKPFEFGPALYKQAGARAIDESPDDPSEVTLDEGIDLGDDVPVITTPGKPKHKGG